MTDCEASLAESGSLAFRVALGLLRRREDAEDVAQDAVVKALQRFGSLRDRSRFRPWLVRLTWRLARDRRRGESRRAVRDMRIVSPALTEAGAERELIMRERTERLWAAIDDLPPKLRLPLVLACLEGFTVEDVSALLRVPAGTVKSRTFEARRQLKKKLINAGIIASMVAFALVVWPRTRPLQPTGQMVAPLPVARVQASAVPAVPTVASRNRLDTRPPSPARRDAHLSQPQQATEIPAVPLIGVPRLVPPTIEIRVVDTRVVHIPVVYVPVVSVPRIDVPVVKPVVTGPPETHSEREP